MLRFPLIFVGITQKYSKFHTAIDMGWNNSYGGKNANIYASGNGYVTKIVNGKNNTLIPNQSGNYIDIYYPLENLTVRVCHLLKNSIKVKINEKVTKDSIIAKMGNSGYCGINKAYHTHVIVFKDNRRVDPLEYLYFDYDFNILAKSNTAKIKYFENKNIKSYIMINTKNGVWCRKGAGFNNKKYKAIPYGTKCELITKNYAFKNNYWWDLINYNGELVYVPNKWNKYLQN